MITLKEAQELTEEERVVVRETESRIDEAIRGHCWDPGNSPLRFPAQGLPYKVRTRLIDMYGAAGWARRLVSPQEPLSHPFFEIAIASEPRSGP